MKICHVVYECVPGKYAGGVQKMVLELASAQGVRGDEVEIWTIGNGARVEVGAGVRIRYFAGRVRWNSVSMGEALRDEGRIFEAIHAHNTFLPLNRMVAKLGRSGARVFFHSHGALDLKLLTGWSFKALKKRLYVGAFECRNYNAAQAVFGLTSVECRQLELTGTNTAIYEVSNGINPQPPPSFVASIEFRLRHRIAPGQPVILFVGRITHKKGIHTLVDALASVRINVPNALLVICGGRDQDIEYVKMLDEQIRRVRMESHVRWAGFQDEEGKRAAFASCTVFAHPSYSEGMALAVLEAMSIGVPAVVTPGCYMDQAVAAGALKLAQQSVESLAEAITGLLLDRKAANDLGACGRAYVAKHHSWPVIADRLASIYAGEPEPAPYRGRIQA